MPPSSRCEDQRDGEILRHRARGGLTEPVRGVGQGKNAASRPRHQQQITGGRGGDDEQRQRAAVPGAANRRRVSWNPVRTAGPPGGQLSVSASGRRASSGVRATAPAKNPPPSESVQ